MKTIEATMPDGKLVEIDVNDTLTDEQIDAEVEAVTADYMAQSQPQETPNGMQEADKAQAQAPQAGPLEALFPRTMASTPFAGPVEFAKAGVGTALDIASLPGRALASLPEVAGLYQGDQMGTDEQYNALGQSLAQTRSAQGGLAGMAASAVRDPLSALAFTPQGTLIGGASRLAGAIPRIATSRLGDMVRAAASSSRGMLEAIGKGAAETALQTGVSSYDRPVTGAESIAPLALNTLVSRYGVTPGRLQDIAATRFFKAAKPPRNIIQSSAGRVSPQSTKSLMDFGIARGIDEKSTQNLGELMMDRLLERSDDIMNRQRPAANSPIFNRPEVGISIGKIAKGSPVDELDLVAESVLKNREIPEGYYVHGRNSSSGFGDYQAQMTKDMDVAEQYAGRDGSTFLIKEPDAIEVMDIYKGSPDYEAIAKKVSEEHDAGYLQNEFYDGLRSKFKDPYEASAEEIGYAVADEFAPSDIVNSAQAFDEPVWLEWLSDRFPEKTFYKTPDGAISVDAANSKHVNLSDFSKREPIESSSIAYSPENPILNAIIESRINKPIKDLEAGVQPEFFPSQVGDAQSVLAGTKGLVDDLRVLDKIAKNVDGELMVSPAEMIKFRRKLDEIARQKNAFKNTDVNKANEAGLYLQARTEANNALDRALTSIKEGGSASKEDLESISLFEDTQAEFRDLMPWIEAMKKRGGTLTTNTGGLLKTIKGNKGATAKSILSGSPIDANMPSLSLPEAQQLYDVAATLGPKNTPLKSTPVSLADLASRQIMSEDPQQGTVLSQGGVSNVRAQPVSKRWSSLSELLESK